VSVLDKIASFLDARPGMPVFINFGGGEPFLRRDMLEIARETASRFGPQSVGIDTNGTRAVSREGLAEILPSLAYLGVSLDGLRAYHNTWRAATSDRDPFREAVDTIQAVLELPNGSEKLEVSTVPTKQNIEAIPDLMRFLDSLGVKKYSAHRAMLVGRYWLNRGLETSIPTADDYLRLLVSMLEANRDLNMNMHVHHSIESIYAALLLGTKTYFERPLGNPDKRSSIGIDWRGRVFFDPWCMVEPLDSTASASLLDPDVTLESILHDKSWIAQAKGRCVPAIRCKGCPVSCSGGSRTAAALDTVANDCQIRVKRQVSSEAIFTALEGIDPLCPLHPRNLIQPASS